MKVYGRIQNGVIAELVTTELSISSMFHPALVWVDLTAQVGVAPGWLWNGTVAIAPVANSVLSVSPATLSQLQTQIGALQARLAALSSATMSSGGSS